MTDGAPPDETAAALLARGALSADHVALLARALATLAREGDGIRLDDVGFTGDPAGAAEDFLFEAATVELPREGAGARTSVDALAQGLIAASHTLLAEYLRARYAMEAGDFDLYAELTADRSEVATPPFVIAMAGYLAAGKSTLASRLSQALGVPVVMTDLTRKQLLGAAPTENLFDAFGAGAYDPAFSERVYAEVDRRAAHALAGGRAVVLDGSYRKRADRERARELAAGAGVPFLLVECRVPEEVCRARLADRDVSKSVSDGRLEIFDPFVNSYEPVTELADDELLVVDTTRPLGELVETVRARLPTR